MNRAIEQRPEIHGQFWTEEATHTFLVHPVIAVCCGRATTWLVNRNGRTRCPECDEAECARLLERELAFARMG
jgi:hypothetical protein